MVWSVRFECCPPASPAPSSPSFFSFCLFWPSLPFFCRERACLYADTPRPPYKSARSSTHDAGGQNAGITSCSKRRRLDQARSNGIPPGQRMEVRVRYRRGLEFVDVLFRCQHGVAAACPQLVGRLHHVEHRAVSVGHRGCRRPPASAHVCTETSACRGTNTRARGKRGRNAHAHARGKRGGGQVASKARAFSARSTPARPSTTSRRSAGGMSPPRKRSAASRPA
jgi:hypothetical protein